MSLKFMRGAVAGVCLAMAMNLAPPALAGAISRDGFAFPKDGEVRVVVFRPDVSVGSLKVGGLDEPNADWTTAARTNIQTAMENAGEARTANLKFLGDFTGADELLVNEYRGLFEAVAGAVFQHTTLGDHLPTKQALTTGIKPRKYYKLDWTLGAEAQRLKAVTGGG